MGTSWSHGFEVDNASGKGLTWIARVTGEAPVGSIAVDQAGRFEFRSDSTDGGHTYSFEVEVSSDTSEQDVCQFTVEVVDSRPFLIRIGYDHLGALGEYSELPISIESGSEQIGGFDFKIGYSDEVLTLVSVDPGDLLNDCGWEYFSYTLGSDIPCEGPCPSGMVRLRAIADVPWESETPSCFGGTGDLAILRFLVSDNPSWECHLVPISFIWQESGDNSLASVSGETLFVSTEVHDYQWNGDFNDPSYLLPVDFCDSAWSFTYGGPCPEWNSGPVINPPLEYIFFWNGAIDLSCTEPVDSRGDINLNGINHEIQDTVLFAHYFVESGSAFDIDQDEQIARSDVNRDGTEASVADLIYLINIIAGDALPFSHLHPEKHVACVTWQEGHFTIESSVAIGAVWAIFATEESPELTNYTEMEIERGTWSTNKLSFLLYPGFSNTSMSVSSGRHELFRLQGEASVVNVQVSDREGNMMMVRVNGWP